MDETDGTAGEAFAPGTRWLQLTFGGSAWTFELEPTEERAIVVGSLLRAHVRIDLPRVAPVHFHFEREGDAVRLICAYGADVRVNGDRVHGAVTLEGHASIEFADARMDAIVSDAPPDVQSSPDCWGWREQGGPLPLGQALAEFPVHTSAAFPRTLRATLTGLTNADTAAFQPFCDVHVQSRGAAPLAPPAPEAPESDAPFLQAESAWLQLPVEQRRGDTTASLVARLGVLTIRRPLLVALAATAGSVLITLALLAMANIAASTRSYAR